jgi:uncharacterized protein YuzE
MAIKLFIAQKVKNRAKPSIKFSSPIEISTDSEEVAPGIVLDFDENNRVVGIEIEDASKSISNNI